MSDHTRIQREELEHALADAHRAAAPPVPGADALDRVRLRAEGLAAERSRGSRTDGRPAPWQRRVAWGAAVAVTTAAVVLGLSLTTLERENDLVFAQERAVAAFAPTGKVVHFIENFSHTDIEGGRSSTTTATTEVWVDVENGLVRTEGVSGSGRGEQRSIVVMSDGRTRTMWNDGSVWQVREERLDPVYTLEQYTRWRELVLADDAEGVNVVEFDGEPCWEVVWSDKADDDYTERITVLFRQSDYQPVRIEVEINSLERELRTVRVSELELWEVLEPEAIDPVLFDRQALNAEGVFENREYGPEDIAELAEFDAWLLSQKYEGTAYAPPWRFSRPGRHELATSAGGELEALYFTEPESNQPAVALLVVARISDNEIETWLDGPSGTASAWEGSATESEWRHVEDRRYYERVGIGANTYSRALVTLGDATIVVSTSDSAATARAIAALTRMNPPAEERRQPAFQVPPFVGLIEKPAEKPAEEPSDDRTPLADHSVQVDGGVEWTIENAEGWPNGLLGVAQGVVTQVAGYERWTLTAPEVAASADGTRWAIFTALVTDSPEEFDGSTVVMKQAPSGAWTVVAAGTGIPRAEVLPPDLLDSGFGEELLGW